MTLKYLLYLLISLWAEAPHEINMCWGVGLPSSEKLVNPGGEFELTPKYTPKYTDFLLFSGGDPLKPPLPPKYTPKYSQLHSQLHSQIHFQIH